MIKEVVLLSSKWRGAFSLINQVVAEASNPTSFNYEMNTNFVDSIYSKEENFFDWIFETPISLAKNIESVPEDLFPIWLVPIIGDIRGTLFLSKTPYKYGSRPYIDDFLFLNKIFNDRFVIKKEILNRINECHKRFLSKRVLGIHARTMDIKTSYNPYSITPNGRKFVFADINDYIKVLNKKIDDFDAVFVSTESMETLNKIKDCVANKEVISFGNEINLAKENKCENFAYINYVKDKKESLILSFVESFLLSKCDFLIYNGCSNLSRFSLMLNPNINCENVITEVL